MPDESQPMIVQVQAVDGTWIEIEGLTTTTVSDDASSKTVPVLGLDRLALEQRQSLHDAFKGKPDLGQLGQFNEGELIPPYRRIYEYVQDGRVVEREQPEVGGQREAEIHATIQGHDGGDGWRVALSADHTHAELVEAHRKDLPIEQQLAAQPIPSMNTPASVRQIVFAAGKEANGHASWGGHPVILVYCDGRRTHDVLEVARWEIGPRGALGWSGGPVGASTTPPRGRPRIDKAREGQEHIGDRVHIATATVTLREGRSALYAVSCSRCSLQMPPVAHEKLTTTIQKAQPYLPRYRDVSVVSLYELSTIVGRLY